MRWIGKIKPIATPALALLFAVVTGAFAASYDDFKVAGIDRGKWETAGNAFRQPGDGYLYVSAAGPTPHSLVSKSLFSSGVFSISFKDYLCNNTAPSGRGLGSILGFGLGSRKENNWMRIERGQIRPDPQHGMSGGYLEVNWVDPNEAGHPIHVNWLEAEHVSGSLQIRFDGKEVAFFYKTDTTGSWTPMPKTDGQGRPVLVNGQRQPLVRPARWTSPVPLFINVFPGGTSCDGYSLSGRLFDLEAGTKQDD